MTYAYDRVGNRTQMVESRGDGSTYETVYDYDARDRLTRQRRVQTQEPSLVMGPDGQFQPYTPPRPPSRWAPRGLAAFAAVTLAGLFVPFGLLWAKTGTGSRWRRWCENLFSHPFNWHRWCENPACPLRFAGETSRISHRFNRRRWCENPFSHPFPAESFPPSASSGGDRWCDPGAPGSRLLFGESSPRRWRWRCRSKAALLTGEGIPRRPGPRWESRSSGAASSFGAGRRARRQRCFVRTIALMLVPLLAVDPQMVWAVHAEALAYQALAATGLGQTSPDDVVVSYDYDGNGNLIGKTTNSGGTSTAETYVFDAESRLASFQPDNAGPTDIVAYTYDFDGIRTRKAVGGSITRYITDKNRDYAQVLEERNAAGVETVRYVYGHDLISQTRDPHGPATTTHYFHYDGQLSTRMLTDGTTGSPAYGQVTDSYTYDAFGNELGSTGSMPNAYRYTGEQYDANVAFYYLRARYYDQSTGRFASTDPAEGVQRDPLTLHRYLYASGNPTNRSDPSGLFSMAEVLTTQGIQNILVRILNTYTQLRRVYEFARRVLDVIDFARQAIRLVYAAMDPSGLTLASVLQAAFHYADSQGLNSTITGAFAAAFQTLGKRWSEAVGAITSRLPLIVAQEVWPAVQPRVPNYLRLHKQGNLRFVVQLPTAPGRRSPDRVIPLGTEAGLAVGVSGGRLLGVGVKTSKGGTHFDWLLRIDYWDVRATDSGLHIHYHVPIADGPTDKHTPDRTIWRP